MPHCWTNCQKSRQKLNKNKYNGEIQLACLWALCQKRFDKFVISGNGNAVWLLRDVWKFLWNHIEWTNFWWILAIWIHCAPPRQRGSTKDICYGLLLSVTLHHYSELFHRVNRNKEFLRTNMSLSHNGTLNLNYIFSLNKRCNSVILLSCTLLRKKKFSTIFINLVKLFVSCCPFSLMLLYWCCC